MTTKLPWLVPVVFAATPLVAEAAPSDRDTASTDGSTSVTSTEQEHDPATDIASITADRGIVTRPGRFTIEIGRASCRERV